jgi:hypothetical protein
MTFQAPQLADFPVILEVMTLIQSDGLLEGTNTGFSDAVYRPCWLGDWTSCLLVATFVAAS